MSTRGLWGFVVDGEVKVTYNHYDSYPSGLGDDLLRFARGVARGIQPSARERVAALRMVDASDGPSASDVERLARFANLNVGSQEIKDWYVLLRETQGNPVATLDAGAMIDSRDFAADSLFCEWGYVIDLDANVFEVYCGFQHAQHSDGRFAADERPERRTDGYWPIRLIATYPLDALPDELDEDALDPEEGEGE